MKVTLEITEDDERALRLLLRHFPMWFREDSDGCGTHEDRAKAIVRRLLARPVKLSLAQRRMLRNAYEGDPHAGIHGQSAHGGAAGTARSLFVRGLMTQEYDVTEAGRAAITCPSCGHIHLVEDGPMDCRKAKR